MRLHVDQNVRDPVEAFLDYDADLGRDVVRGLHGEVRVDLEVQIDVVFHSGLPRETFFDGESAGHSQRDLADLVEQGLLRHRVHQLQSGIAHHTKPERDDDDAHSETTYLVEGDEPLWI